MGELADKHVVVTGGAGALGAGIVLELLERGAIVHVPRIEADLRSMPAPPWADSDRVHSYPSVDLTNEASAVEFFAKPPSLWGSVHAAGGFSMSPIAETSLATWQRQADLNLTTAFLSCREAVKRMREHGPSENIGRGRIVNVAARPALSPVAGMSAYSVAKAGVAALTRSLAEEVRGEGIFVNALVPSVIDSAANRAAMPDADHSKWPKPEQLAMVAAFLLSPANAVTHGALVPVFGHA